MSAFTVTLWGAHSTASARVSPTTPALLATYAATSNRPTNDDSEPTVVIRPCFCAIIGRPKTWQARSVPVRFVSITRAIGLVHLERRALLGHPCDGEQDVDLAERLEALVAQSVERRDLGHVGGDRQRPPPALLNLGGDVLDELDAAAARDHVGARVSQPQRQGAADSLMPPTTTAVRPVRSKSFMVVRLTMACGAPARGVGKRRGFFIGRRLLRLVPARLGR